MSIRRILPLVATAALALAVSAGAWAQDGRGHGRQGDRGEQQRGDRGDRAAMGEGNRMRAMPEPRAMRPEPRPRPEQRQQRRRDDSMADSVRRIQRTTRGRVINAERVQSDGRSVNRIKVMDDRGRIRVYMDDPAQRRGAPTRDDDN